MTLFSLIAFVAIALIWLFAMAQNWYFVGENDKPTVWRSMFKKVVKFFDIQWGLATERPFSWRRFVIKLFLVALIVAALYGGFRDCYEVVEKCNVGQVFEVIFAIILLVVTFVVMWGVQMLFYEDNPFTSNHFDIKESRVLIKSVNIAVACSWVVMFVLLYCFDDGHVFALIGISAICTFVIDMALLFIGILVYLSVKNFIVIPIKVFVKWLLK